METRYSVHPEQISRMDTAALRKSFLIDNLFQSGTIVTVYTHDDRLIIGSAVPTGGALTLAVSKELGVDYFLQRREMGIINVGEKGRVTADGKSYTVDRRDALYIGMGTKEVRFESADPAKPAKFYFNSAPAHAAHPTKLVKEEEAKQTELGSAEKANVRTLRQYIHPAILPTCQLVMGLTRLAPGSVWNTMPPHTHERRMEVYLYFDIPDDSLVVHVMGAPRETRHLMVRNQEAIISPSWSVHSGVGTNCYSFIWGMGGENQTYTDIDEVPVSSMK